MQASLPKVVRMVSVEDLGQGSESFRILGVRWLPAGAAAKSVSKDGEVESQSEEDQQKSKKAQLNETMSHDSSTEKGENKQEGQEDEQGGNVTQGMEAEEGDFVNMEIAFAYRARGGGKDMQSRAKNAHLYLAFYLPANIKLRKFHYPVRASTFKSDPYSRLGRAARHCWDPPCSSPAYTGPAVLLAVHTHVHGTAEAGPLLHSPNQEGTEHHGPSVNLQLRPELNGCGDG